MKILVIPPIRLLINIVLYSIVYILVSLKSDSIFNYITGIFIINIAVIIDYFLARLKYRWFIRFLSTSIIIIVFFIITLISSELFSDKQTLNFFDFISYYFLKDCIPAIVFIAFYYFFDSERVVKRNMYSYAVSTILLLLGLYYITSIKNTIEDSIFVNYFNYSFVLLSILILIILRHITMFSKDKKIVLKDYLLLILIFCGMIFFLISVTLSSFVKGSGNNSGGLFESGLFKFDFNNFLELKDSIKLSEDRVLILELDGSEKLSDTFIRDDWNRQLYIKRFSLEEFVSPGGFKVSSHHTETNAPPPFLTGYSWERPLPGDYFASQGLVETLYIVNIDPSSVLGSEFLYKIVPIELWKDAPFKQVYKSFSSVYVGDYNDIYADLPQQNDLFNAISVDRKNLLLDWGGEKDFEKRIQTLALSLTDGYSDPFLKTVIIQNYLRDNYYYSLKPGLSGKLSPVEYFLFEAKKGYCSYFAFSMTIMLRSIGIASRVAVGFAPDMNNKTMNFYDVRVNDGHAWVEVFFDRYGWVNFDPTSSTILPDEEFSLPKDRKDERLSLVENIMQNKDNMIEVTRKPDVITNVFSNLTSLINRSIRLIGVVVLVFFVTLLFLVLFFKKNVYLIAFYFSQSDRKKIKYLWRYQMTGLLALGFPIEKNESITEYAKRIFDTSGIDIRTLTEFYQEVIFGNETRLFDKPEKWLYAYKLDIKKIPLRKRIQSYCSLSILFRRIVPLFVILFIPYFSFGDEKDIHDYIVKAKEAVHNSYYDMAIKILNEAEAKFPESYLPDYEKATIYFDNEIYGMAVKEFTDAKKKGLQNEDIYSQIANSYSKQGKDELALSTYEEAITIINESVYLVDNLGWLYYKTHNYTKGIEFIESKLTVYGKDPDILMTLGTLYSSIWDYEKAKSCYISAISNSYNNKLSEFRAIAYYNLALIEESFLYYDNAHNSMLASLALMDRSSAYMGLAYLSMRLMNLKESYNYIQKASSLPPKTAFPESALCYLYAISGNVDEAITLSESILNNQDFAWMMYFGTSIDGFNGEIYKVLSTAYNYKSAMISYSEKESFVHTVIRPFKKKYYQLKSLYYNFVYSTIFIRLGNKKISGGSDLDGLNQIVSGLEEIAPRRALKVSRIARGIEIPLNRNKQRIYDAEESLLSTNELFVSKDTKIQRIVEAMNRLDPKWEKDMKSLLLVEAIQLSNNKKYNYLKEMLFVEYPQLAPINGIRIPAIIYGEKHNAEIIKKIKKRGFYESYKSKIEIIVSDLDDEKVKIMIKYNNSVLYDFDCPRKDCGVEFYERIFKVQLL